MSDQDEKGLERHTDQALMLLFKDGSICAFNVLFDRYRKLKGYITRQVQSEAIAEDIFQDTWEKIIKASSRYESTATFKTYLFTILHNTIRDHFRRGSTKHEGLYEDELGADAGNGNPIEEYLPTSGVKPDEEAELKQCLGYLEVGLRALPFGQRECFMLKLETGMTMEEIGETLGVGRETIKSRLRYALGKLKSVMPTACLELVQ